MSKHSCAGAEVWEHPLCVFILCGGVCPLACGYSLSQPTGWHWGHWGLLYRVYFSIGSAETMAGESQRPLLVLDRQTLPCWDWTDAFEGEIPWHECIKSIKVTVNIMCVLVKALLWYESRVRWSNAPYIIPVCILFPHQLHLIRFSPTLFAHPLPAYPHWCCSPSNNGLQNSCLPVEAGGLLALDLSCPMGSPGLLGGQFLPLLLISWPQTPLAPEAVYLRIMAASHCPTAVNMGCIFGSWPCGLARLKQMLSSYSLLC